MTIRNKSMSAAFHKAFDAVFKNDPNSTAAHLIPLVKELPPAPIYTLGEYEQQVGRMKRTEVPICL
jgi:hypothetical protein